MNNPPTGSGTFGGGHAAALPAEPEGATRVRELMSAGKFKQAVEAAKEIHKRDKSPASEQLLMNAYLGRIAQFEARGSVDDARTLIKLVSERFPAHRRSLGGLEARAAAAAANIPELLKPLTSPDVTPHVRETIESAIRQELISLSALAETPLLPADHPLRTSADSVWRALQAVTAGPVSDELVALPDVSRRSPLAGWKMLVRAIAAFYRNDDDACRRAIEQIPADAAARRAVPPLLAAIDRTPAAPGAPAVLVSRIQADDKSLPDAFAAFERALEGDNVLEMNRAMRAAVSACTAARPELAERVRQHIGVRCAMADFPAEDVVKAIGRPLKDAYFWRLLARGMEMEGSFAQAALYWERFLVHGSQEGMFAADGPEAAAIYLRAANILSGFDADGLYEIRREFRRHSPLIGMYQGQPSEIAELKPKDFGELANRVLSPALLLRRSAELDPSTTTFSQWLAWAKRAEAPARDIQEIAELWQRKLPSDVQAPLELSSLAESRGSLKLALKHLAAAEAMDAMSPQVRKARLRLTLGVTWGHFKDKKPKLVEKDLADLAAMPAMNEGDRPAFLGALRAIYHALRGDEPAAREAYEALSQQVGPLLAWALMYSVHETARLKKLEVWPVPPSPLLPEPRAVADAVARLSVLRQELRLQVGLPLNWASIVGDVIQERPSKLSQANLLAIGRLALERGNERVAYLASSAGLGLAPGPGAAARFLLLRAQSLPPWADQRFWQCLRAASDLARQANDSSLIAEVATEIDRYPRMFRPDFGRPLGEELLAEVLKREREASSFPKDRDGADRYVVAIDGGRRRGPFDGFDFDLADDEDDDDYDDDDDDEEDEDEEFGSDYVYDDDGASAFNVPGIPKNVPAKALPVLQKIFEKFGHVASAEEILMKDPALALELVMALEGTNLDPKMVNDMVKKLKDLMPRESRKDRKRRK